jgi:hypothetical protein
LLPNCQPPDPPVIDQRRREKRHAAQQDPGFLLGGEHQPRAAVFGQRGGIGHRHMPGGALDHEHAEDQQPVHEEYQHPIHPQKFP